MITVTTLQLYFPLLASISSLMITQGIKFIYFYTKNIPISLKTIFQPGGMPSTHSAMVMGLSTAVGLQLGFHSAEFSIAFIFASIVLYDATSVRRAVGNQATVVNTLQAGLNKENHPTKKLPELIGHTPFEVTIGTLIGILWTILLYQFLFLGNGLY